MKRTITSIFAIILALAMGLSLSACGGSGENKGSTASENSNIEAKIDKNDPSNYLGRWETKEYYLIINKGGVGQCADKDIKPNHLPYDFNWEINDGVIIIQIERSGSSYKSSLELNDDGTALLILQASFPLRSDDDKELEKVK